MFESLGYTSCSMIYLSKTLFFVFSCVFVIRVTFLVRKKTSPEDWNHIKGKLFRIDLKLLIFIIFFSMAYFISIHLNIAPSDGFQKLFDTSPAASRAMILFMIQSFLFSALFVSFFIFELMKILLNTMPERSKSKDVEYQDRASAEYENSPQIRTD